MEHDQGHLLGQRYRLVSVVGRGGMGTVWRAHDEVLHRDVAVKEVLFPPGLGAAGKQVLYERTFREARASARLSDPGVVTVHDVVQEGGRPWIVMEFIRARSLQEIIDKDGPLPPDAVAGIGHQTLMALRHAHAAGVLHRDVKPSNVLVTVEGRAVLTDFGIAQAEGDTRLTQAGLVMGSPCYIPPERVRGERAVPASDLWALGATLYAAVEGGPPFERADAAEALAAALSEPVPPARDAGPLWPVLRGLLARDPAHRLTADQALPMLEEVAGRGGGHGGVRGGTAAGPAGEPAHGRPDDVRTRVEETPSRHHERTLLETARPGHDLPRVGTTGPDHGRAQVGTGPPPEFPAWRPDTARSAAHRGERGKTIVIVGISAILVVAALLTGTFVLRAGRAAPGGGSMPQSGGGSTPPRRGAPAGYRTVTEDGFSGAVPETWTRRAVGRSVFWDSPDKRTYLQIDRTVWEGSAVQAASKAEAGAAGGPGFPGYRLAGLSSARYQGTGAADWEFTFDGPEGRGPIRARDRFVCLGGRPYAIYFRAPEAEWASSLSRLETFYTTFEPR